MRLALAGDTMLGRHVGARIAAGDRDLWSDGVRATIAEADLAICNLECCISDRGRPWPAAGKPFHFRAPPAAATLLAGLGIDAVTLANNHALDYGEPALADTIAHLDAAGIAHTGAGEDVAGARTPAICEAGRERLGLVGFADHPADFAAGRDRAGIAYADLAGGVPSWVTEAVAACDAGLVVATPHWGPNMTPHPVRHVRAAAPELVRAGARIVAGHSAHCFHGVARHDGALVCYDLGDFIDDYAVHPERRNDLGLLRLVDVAGGRPRRLEAVPLVLDPCHTRLAGGEEAAWIQRRFEAACAAHGVAVARESERLVVDCP